MSKVMLPNAYDQEKERLIHISERVPRTLLVCPYCDGPVIPRKGKQRQHHFAHKVQATCNPAPETLLHDGAKNYIAVQLEKNKSFEIHFQTSVIVDGNIRNLLEILKIESFVISSSNILSLDFIKHKTEAAIWKYRADVMSYSERPNRKFAWEVVVTHQMEEDKYRAFIENDLPFIEVKVNSDDEGGYKFTALRYSLENVLFGKSVFVNSDMSKLFHEEVKEHIANRLLQRASSLEVGMKPVALVNMVKINDNMDEKINERLGYEYVKFRVAEFYQFPQKTKQYTTIKLNSKYEVNSAIALLKSLIERLAGLNYMEGLLGYDARCIGVSIHSLNYIRGEWQETEIVTSSERHESKFNIECVYCKYSKKGYPYLVVNDDKYNSGIIVSKINTLLKKLIEYLGEEYNLMIEIGVNKKGYKVVTGLIIGGMLDEHAAKQKMRGEIARKIVSFVEGNLV